MNVEDDKLISRLEELKYPKLSEKDIDIDSFDDQFDNIDNSKNYNYLLKMPVNSLTKNNLEKLKKNAENIENEINILKETPIYKIWYKELTEVKEEYNKYKTELEEVYRNDLLSISKKK